MPLRQDGCNNLYSSHMQRAKLYLSIVIVKVVPNGHVKTCKAYPPPMQACMTTAACLPYTCTWLRKLYLGIITITAIPNGHSRACGAYSPMQSCQDDCSRPSLHMHKV